MTWRTSAAVAAKTAAASGVVARPRCGRVPRSTTARSASAPGSSAPGLGPADARRGRPRSRRVSSAATSCCAADAGREPLVELDRARLLERVDDRLRVAAGGQRGAGVGQPARGADAVGEVALGGRAQADGRAAAEQRDVGVGQVRRVDGGEVARPARRRRPAPRSACGRARRGTTRSRRGCSETWACSGRPSNARRRRAALAGSTARTLWMAAPTRAAPGSIARDALGPRVRARVAEALDAAVQVARVEQRDPHARRRPPRRSRRGPSRWVVGRPVGPWCR